MPARQLLSLPFAEGRRLWKGDTQPVGQGCLRIQARPTQDSSSRPPDHRPPSHRPVSFLAPLLQASFGSPQPGLQGLCLCSPVPPSTAHMRDSQPLCKLLCLVSLPLANLLHSLQVVRGLPPPGSPPVMLALIQGSPPPRSPAPSPGGPPTPSTGEAPQAGTGPLGTLLPHAGLDTPTTASVTPQGPVLGQQCPSATALASAAPSPGPGLGLPSTFIPWRLTL